MSSSEMGPTTNVPDEDEVTIGGVFLICVVLVGSLIGLVLLRFLVNVLIDLLILNRNPVSRSSFFDFCCCFSLVDSSSNHPSRSARDTSNATTTSPTMANCLSAGDIDVEMSTSAVLSKILPEHLLTQADWENLVARQTSLELESGTATSNSITVVECSICLQDIVAGMPVHETKRCRHFFHAHCIREWLVGTHYSRPSNSQFNNHCPNCRGQLVEPELCNQLMAPNTQR